MNNKLLETLETCLQALEKGETLDSVLARFPAIAADLRPMLQASLHARTLAGPSPSDAILRRGRARLLQHAAVMRETKASSRRAWLFNLRPLAVALMLAVFFFSGTTLARASSASLPGDNLYPVKRAWEGVRLVFTFAQDARVNLELEYETERLEEIGELLAEGRVEAVSFSGYVTVQRDGQWMVSGIPVIVSAQTRLPNEPIQVGSAVTVYGITALAGHVEAHGVDTVPPGVPIPTPRPEKEEGEDEKETPTAAPTPVMAATPTPVPTATVLPAQTQTGGGNENANGNDNENENENENGNANDDDNDDDNDHDDD